MNACLVRFVFLKIKPVQLINVLNLMVIVGTMNVIVQIVPVQVRQMVKEQIIALIIVLNNLLLNNVSIMKETANKVIAALPLVQILNVCQKLSGLALNHQINVNQLVIVVLVKNAHTKPVKTAMEME